MVLDDELGGEYEPVLNGENENVEITLGNVSLSDFAAAYIDAHPEKNHQYAHILDSNNSKEIKTLQMRAFVYGKIIDEIKQKQQAQFNPEKYTLWIAELRASKWKIQSEFSKRYSASDDTKAYHTEKIDEKKV